MTIGNDCGAATGLGRLNTGLRTGGAGDGIAATGVKAGRLSGMGRAAFAVRVAAGRDNADNASVETFTCRTPRDF